MQFSYVARTKDGQLQSGHIEAPSETAAVDILHRNDLIIINVGKVGGALFGAQIRFFQRVRPKELVAFSRQLAILFSAKVSLVESFTALSRQTNNAYFKDTLADIANEVEGGTLLSKAFSRHPRIFDKFYVNLIRSGEASGNLENSLNYMADYIEHRYYLLSKVRAAMIYPAFILVVFIAALILFVFKIFPSIFSLLQDTGSTQNLPWTTRAIIAVSDFGQAWWWLILVLFIGGVTSIILTYRTPWGRAFLTGLNFVCQFLARFFKKFI
jgi:type IV pilus assembly protein PilC